MSSEIESYIKGLQHEAKAEEAGFIDYSQFNEDSSEPWQDIYDNDLNLAQNLINILNQSVLLPSSKIQTPIAIAYMLIPSAIAKIVPILFSHGQAGTGKSTVGYLAAKLHNAPINTSGDTFASIRNYLEAARWHFPEQKRGEKNTILIWDDIDEAVFISKPDIYRLLKYGYDKSSDQILIAGKDGENLVFRVFSPKITSSIQSLHNHPKYPELQRRVIVLKHKKLELFTKQEKEESEIACDFIAGDRLDLKAVDWTGFYHKFNDLWRDIDTCKLYAATRKKLTSRGKKPFQLNEFVTAEKFTISVDIICAGVTCGVWENLIDGVEAINKYWQWHKENIADEAGAMLKLVKQFIEQETNQARLTNEGLGFEACPIEINPDKLKKKLNYWQDTGQLDMTPRTDVIVNVMRQLGWRLEPGKWVEDR